MRGREHCAHDGGKAFEILLVRTASVRDTLGRAFCGSRVSGKSAARISAVDIQAGD